jgi:LuxR family transcriptional regulator, maltose regulon positive regulatory protein
MSRVTVGPPQSRSVAVRRQDMLSRLAAVGQETQLVLLVAPPGYGKTVVLRQWAESSDRAVGWVEPGEAGNDPTTLLRDITSAVAASLRAPDDFGREPEEAMPDTGAPLAGLVASLHRIQEPAVIVLDDLQLIRRSAALEVLAGLPASLPANWLLVLASQRPPRMRLGRLRSQGRLVEFGTNDLAFGAGEVGELLGRLGVDLPDEAVQAILARTEGWPSGVHLAGLSMAGGPGTSAAAAEIAEGSRHVADYFREEILSRQSAETVRFLLRTSMLDRMCAPLCDAVLNTSGSAAWLTEIQALNLFIVPEDDRGDWYRYHRMFAEMLQSELRRREPEEEFRVRRRASAWYEQEGRAQEAVSYAMAAGDHTTTVRLITANAQDLHSEGRVSVVQGWLDSLDEKLLQDHPTLAAMGAWIWAETGDAARALRSLRIAESGTFDGPMPDGSASLESAVVRARAGLAPNGVAAMLADAKRAIDLEPPGSRWHTRAALLHGSALLLAGRREEAGKEFARAARVGPKPAWPGASFALGQRSLLAADEGDWPAAAACVEQSYERIEAAGLRDYLTSLPTYLACARLALHRGDTRAAKNAAAATMRLFRRPSPVAFPWLDAQMRVALGQVLLDLGDAPAARLEATEASRLLASLPTESPLREQHRRLLTDLDRTSTRTNAMQVTRLTTAELRILQLLPTHLSLGALAQELLLSRNTVKAEVAAIYRKLDASNRAEAVQKAADLGLLG